MSELRSIRPATPGDRSVVVNTVVAAFVQDPAFRFFFPDDATYKRQATHFVGYLFEKRVVHDSVWMTHDGAAAALWSPPADDVPATGPSASAENTSHDLRATMLEAIGREAAARLNMYDVVVDGLLPANDSYWYLGILALRPDRRGSGLGRAVMDASLHARSDDAGAGRPAPAYLETTNPANVEYYQRCGWQVTQTAVTNLGEQPGAGAAGLCVTVLRYD